MNNPTRTYKSIAEGGMTFLKAAYLATERDPTDKNKRLLDSISDKIIKAAIATIPEPDTDERCVANRLYYEDGSSFVVFISRDNGGLEFGDVRRVHVNN